MVVARLEGVSASLGQGGNRLLCPVGAWLFVCSQHHQPRQPHAQQCEDICPSARMHLSAQVIPPGLSPPPPALRVFHRRAGGEASLSPSLSPPRRGPSRADGSGTAPGRSLHPHVRCFLCPALCVPPSPHPSLPATASAPLAAPTRASHTHK